MKKQFLLVFALFVAVLFSACKDNGTDPVVEPPVSSDVVEVSGEIKANTTWSANKIYMLKGFVYVSNGATLTIEPGTIIKGEKSSKGTLIITRGSKINATGTVDKPIVFTSAQTAGGRSQGDWGGLIILGKAPVNQGNDVKIEGGLTAPTGVTDDKPYIYYGGTDAADNSGVIKYVRIEFAGIAFSPDNEINGLTLGGVGTGTTIDYVEVYRSGDDSFEWFGGTVNAKHLLSIASFDDDFDTDFGYSGKVQFALAQRVASVADASGSNGFESDNDGTGSNLAPQTSAIFSNVTILGPIYKSSGITVNANFQNAAQIRRNSALSIFNSVFTGYVDGVYIDDSKVVTAKSTSANYLASRLAFANNLVLGTKTSEVKGENKADFETVLRAANTFNTGIYADSLFSAPSKYSLDFKAKGDANQGTPSFILKSATNIAATGALFTDAKLTSGFEAVAYKGAFGSTDWSASWAHYDPQTLAYTTPGAVK